MADKHNENIPAVANTIVADVPKIKENLEFHKDCFEAIATGWSNTVATGLHVNDLDATVVRNSVTSHVQAVAYTAEKTKTVSDLNADGIYRITCRLVSASASSLALRFNADTAGNYTWIYNYLYDGDSASTGYTYQTAQSSIILGLSVYSTINILEMVVGSVPGSTENILVSFKHSGYGATPYLITSEGTGYYYGTSAMTSLTLLCAQNLTGTMHVERIA